MTDLGIDVSDLTADGLKKLCQAHGLETGAKVVMQQGVTQLLEARQVSLAELMAGRETREDQGRTTTPASGSPTPAAAAAGAGHGLVLQLTPPGTWEPGDSRDRAKRWEIYKGTFRTYITAMGNIGPAREKALFLHVAGPEVRRHLEALIVPESDDSSPLEATWAVLDAVLAPKASPIFENFRMGEMSQNRTESTDQYVSRIRRQAKFCDLKCGACGHPREDERVLEIVIRHTVVPGLRERVFERNITSLEELLKIARAMESARSQAAEMSHTGAAPFANYTKKAEKKTDGDKKSGGNSGHDCGKCGKQHGKERRCPAEGKKCGKCSKLNHFKAVCRSGPKTARFAEEDQDDGSDEGYGLFHVEGRTQIRGTVVIDGRAREMVLDTGCSVNCVPASFVSPNKLKNLKTASRLTVYGENKSVTPLGATTMTVSTPGGDIEVKRRFLVMKDGTGPPLLGLDLCSKLGFIEVNEDMVHMVRDGEADSEEQPPASPVAKVEPPKKWNADVENLVHEFQDVFAENNPGVKGVKAHIELKEDATPKFRRARSVPLALREKVSAELDKMIKRGTLVPTKTSEWASPMVTIAKPDGGVRLCADYTGTLASQINTECYPLPKPEELFGVMSGGKVYASLDLRHSYEQLELDEASKAPLTVNTIKGLMRYSRLPYGISSAGAIVQRAMEELLAGMENVHCFVDDIIVRSDDMKSHLSTLRELFKRFRAAGVRLKKPKCNFADEKVKFLGFIVGKDGRAVDKERIRAVVDMPIPTSVTELRCWIGMVRFYDRFVPGLSGMADPLHQLLKKDQEWTWGPEQQKAVQQIKECLTTAPVLQHYDPARELVLATDAGPNGLGACLAHRDENGQEHPIAYASRSLSKAERNYSQIDKEATAIVFGVTKFETFLWARKWILVTDHKPLQAIFGPKNAFPALVTARLHRYAVKLMPYNFQVEFREGKRNGNADCLSRLPLKPGRETGESYWLFQVDAPEEVGGISWQQVKEATETDAVLQEAIKAAQEGFRGKCPKPELEPFWRTKAAIGVEDGVLTRAGRPVLPTELRSKFLKTLHSTHQGVNRMKSRAREETWWPGMAEEIKGLTAACETCQLHAAEPAHVHVEWPAADVWERIHLDYLTYDGKDYLIVVDAGSKWIEVFPMRTTTTKVTLDAVASLVARFGFPKTIQTDGGRQFTSAEFDERVKRWGVAHTVSPPYNPQSNGLAERGVRTVKGFLKKMGPARLQEALFEYRATALPCGRSPAELMLGRPLRTRLTIARPRKKDQSSTTTASRFSSGDKVWALGYGREEAKWLPAVVRGTEGRAVVLLDRSDGGGLIRRHLNQLRSRRGEEM